MCRQLLLLFATLAAVYANDEFVILHSPDSVEFTGNGPIEQSSLKEIMCAALGFTGKQKDTEHSIAVWDPFSMPKALVAIPIDGIEFMPFLKDKTTYPLIVDEVEETTWQAIRSRIEERSNDNTLIRINLSDGVDALGQSALGELKLANMGKLKALNSDVEEDRKFIEEIQLLHAIADKASAKKHECGTDIYWLVVSALKSVMDFHGNTSAAANESYTLLNDAMERVSNAFVNTYDGKVVIVAFTNDASKMRNTRSVLYERQRRDTRDGERDGQNKVKDEEEINSMSSTSESISAYSTTESTTEQTESKINTNTQTIGQPEEFSNRAKIYTENYPVIFNIILWFGVVFFFSLLAICIAIADMDPGRDSIIYRMTSNRMKKDN
ncbi:ATPase H(+)-transporting accessory protein 2 isoform X2 [Linepithema humile]|uniref:ATPase H(+)-transporting accessory protein 2 isoform X2 n=1 Tax=Linepithema humile TaxID=83485 RepID=UPI0006235235|nr:PREDICTED: renin receptor isoform X2 [Linepithema humile]